MILWNILIILTILFLNSIYLLYNRGRSFCLFICLSKATPMAAHFTYYYYSYYYLYFTRWPLFRRIFLFTLICREDVYNGRGMFLCLYVYMCFLIDYYIHFLYFWNFSKFGFKCLYLFLRRKYITMEVCLYFGSVYVCISSLIDFFLAVYIFPFLYFNYFLSCHFTSWTILFQVLLFSIFTLSRKL